MSNIFHHVSHDRFQTKGLSQITKVKRGTNWTFFLNSRFPLYINTSS